MKLAYFDMLSPDPIYIQDIGNVISPKLKDIRSIGIKTYQYYLSILSMDLKSYFSLIGFQNKYEEMSDEEKSELNVFELLLLNDNTLAVLEKVLNFFITDTVIYSANDKCFIVKDKDNVIGYINKEKYLELCNIILQLNYIKPQEEDISKIKSKKALEIFKKIQKGRKNKKKQSNADKNLELGNIISAVANKSNSLNILNIWDLTVYQLWDCFTRISNNTIYNIQSISVATWGDKDNHFDADLWFKKIDI